ncbi:MAG: hotdog fold thioesterase [Chlorobi bacterium]|nr:hotdog fold thioesterase [Chlorobiota bacterium]
MGLPDFTLETLNSVIKGTLMESLGIEFTEATEGLIRARMPVDNRTLQPAGILHGGASLALAETVGSLGSILLVDSELFDVRGSNIQASHIRPVTQGVVEAEARIIYQGKNTHLWNIDIRDDKGNLVSTARLTNFIIRRTQP